MTVLADEPAKGPRHKGAHGPHRLRLRRDSSIREDVNRVLLRHVGSLWWQDITFRYLGRE